MEEPLKSLMQELGNAINDSLNSEQIAEKIEDIKRAGYDVFLVLEATMGYEKRDGDEGKETNTQTTTKTQEVTTNGKVRFTTQDDRFLKALRIKTDPET